MYVILHKCSPSISICTLVLAQQMWGTFLCREGSVHFHKNLMLEELGWNAKFDKWLFTSIHFVSNNVSDGCPGDPLILIQILWTKWALVLQHSLSHSTYPSSLFLSPQTLLLNLSHHLVSGNHRLQIRVETCTWLSGRYLPSVGAGSSQSDLDTPPSGRFSLLPFHPHSAHPSGSSFLTSQHLPEVPASISGPKIAQCKFHCITKELSKPIQSHGG